MLSPVPTSNEITAKGGAMTSPWLAWFSQLYPYLTANPSGGGVVLNTRQILTTGPLTGGGDLSADRTLTISLNGITNAYLAQMPALTIKGNNTGGTANALDLTAAQVKTLLAISLTTDVTGTLQAAQFPVLSGDVTTPGASLATTIAANAVTNAKAAQMPTLTIKGNNTGGTANPLDLTAAQVKTLLAITASDVSGLAAIATSGSASDLTAGTLPAGRFPALTGDVTTVAGALATTIAAGAVTLAKMANLAANSIIGNNTGAPATPIALTTAQVKTLLAISLTTDVTGTLQAAQEPAHTGDVTNTAGNLALTIANNAVSNAKAAQMATLTIKGNNTGGTANALDLTVAQVQTMLSTWGQLLTITPASGQALQVNGISNSWTAIFTAGATAGQSYGLQVNGGTNSGDTAIIVTNQSGARTLLQIFGDGSGKIGDNGTGAAITWTSNGTASVIAQFTTKGYTVALLPAGVTGSIAHVTDALAPAFLTAVVGGGAVKTLVFYNGANWVAA